MGRLVLGIVVVQAPEHPEIAREDATGFYRIGRRVVVSTETVWHSVCMSSRVDLWLLQVDVVFLS